MFNVFSLNTGKTLKQGRQFPLPDIQLEKGLFIQNISINHDYLSIYAFLLTRIHIIDKLYFKDKKKWDATSFCLCHQLSLEIQMSLSCERNLLFHINRTKCVKQVGI